MSIMEPGGADADGVVEAGDNGTHTLRFERRFEHSIDRVWTALTDREELLGWWGRPTSWTWSRAGGSFCAG